MNKLVKKIESNIHVFILNIKEQAGNTKEAAIIIEKFVKGEELTEEDDEILKIQLIDSLKIVGVIIPFVLIPGASILMPLIIKVAKKHKIELLPTAFQDDAEKEKL